MIKVCKSKDKCVHPDGPELLRKEFHRDKSKDGRVNRCGKCCSHRRAEQKRQYYVNNKESILKTHAEYRENNKDKRRESAKQYYLGNIEQLHKKAKEYRYNNKEKRREYDRQWEQNNRGKSIERTARRRAKKLNATPAWADLDKIKEIYADCEEVNLAARTAGCPSTEKFVVDHVIPLQGKLVSGLHVEANLQITTQTENATKHNKFKPIFGAG